MSRFIFAVVLMVALSCFSFGCGGQKSSPSTEPPAAQGSETQPMEEMPAAGSEMKPMEEMPAEGSEMKSMEGTEVAPAEGSEMKSMEESSEIYSTEDMPVEE